MESYGFFNGDTEYGQDEFNRYFKNIYEDGLSRGSNGSLTLSASLSGESVVLTPGCYHAGLFLLQRQQQNHTDHS